MAITFKNDGGQYVNEQGTTLPLPVMRTVPTAPDGSQAVRGRAAAAASDPVVLSNEDKSALDAAKSSFTINNGLYVNNVARAAGTGILAIITTAGTATLTFGGIDIVFPLVVGPTILPLAITKTVLGTAVGSFYAIS